MSARALCSAILVCVPVLFLLYFSDGVPQQFFLLAMSGGVSAAAVLLSPVVYRFCRTSTRRVVRSSRRRSLRGRRRRTRWQTASAPKIRSRPRSDATPRVRTSRPPRRARPPRRHRAQPAAAAVGAAAGVATAAAAAGWPPPRRRRRSSGVTFSSDVRPEQQALHRFPGDPTGLPERRRLPNALV